MAAKWHRFYSDHPCCNIIDGCNVQTGGTRDTRARIPINLKAWLHGEGWYYCMWPLFGLNKKNIVIQCESERTFLKGTNDWSWRRHVWHYHGVSFTSDHWPWFPDFEDRSTIKTILCVNRCSRFNRQDALLTMMEFSPTGRAQTFWIQSGGWPARIIFLTILPPNQGQLGT